MITFLRKENDMYRNWIGATLVALPLAISGLVFTAAQSAGDAKAANAEGIVCPITGEELPCERCCPLND